MPQLDEALRLLQEEVAPRAAAIDQDPDALEAAVALLGEHRLLALRRPEAYGGPGWSDAAYARFQEGVARASGALAFLQTQHQSAVALLGASPNAALAAEVLPGTERGARRLGIGFGHLRRPGPPAVRVTQVAGGYRFDGELPWVTGAGFFPELIGAGVLPDGTAVFALLPLVAGAGVTLGPPAGLAVMEVTRTVTLGLDGVVVPEARVVITRPPGWIQTADVLSARGRSHLALGCAQAGLDALAAVERKGAAVAAARLALAEELAACRAAVHDGPPAGLDDLGVRAWAIELAARVGHAAVAATAGASLLLDRAAQRVYREALAWTVLGQSPAVRDATLARLTRR